MGVRILELEKGKASVELWDVSGDQKYALFVSLSPSHRVVVRNGSVLLDLYSYEACWPAVTKDADGVILVYDPASHVHESEALLWYEWFIQSAGVGSSQCLVFEHSTGGASNSGSSAKPSASKSRLPGNLRSVATSFDTPTVFKSEFDRLVAASLEHQQTAGRANNRK
ncbi:hypothetical protein BBJ28_00006988 [Nothophytophthora sp. Chile5]|nr:hypothetical protein BBJ28_00006988 [Nothophytophthora sp. Chile5]